MRDLNFSSKTLNQYFYTRLENLNKTRNCPLPQEFIFYSSIVLEQYAKLDKIESKALGFSLLEAQNKTSEEQKKIYKRVGDTILVQMGLFPEYLKGKTLNDEYFLSLAKSAYNYMENLDCSFYDIPNFYKLFSSSFENIIKLLEQFGQSNKFESYDDFLISKPTSNNVAS